MDVRIELRRAAGMVRPRPGAGPEAPVPPPLPPGSPVLLPGRGELFVRQLPGPALSPGAARPVLLLHGWMWTADMNWWPAYGPLAEHRRVVAPDHRNHGRSMRTETPFRLEDAADDCAALLDVLEIPRVVVCGYSMGGPIAMLLAERHPEKVAGIVLGATTLDFRSGSLLASARWRLVPLLSALIRLGSFEHVVGRLLRWSADQDPSFAPHRAWFAGEWRRQSAKDIVQCGDAMAGFDMRHRVAALRQLPAAVVLPRADQLVAPWRQRALAEAIGAEVLHLDGDHFANFEASKRFADVIVDAVERVGARVDLRA